MNNLTLPNQRNFSSNEASKLVVNRNLLIITVLAFASGMLTIVEPLYLIAIPAILVLYGMYKLVAFCRDILSMKFDLSGLDFTAEEMENELWT